MTTPILILIRSVLALAGGLAGLLTLGSQPEAPRYRLPFSSPPPRLLLQGNDGPYGHAGHARYAFDFQMPIGTPVVAARAGMVVAVEARFADGTRRPGEENFVVIRHPDSTYARYYHLTHSGVAVEVGRSVAAGDTIGRSGDSGASAGPHLHFDVTRTCFTWGCNTIWIRFTDAGTDSLSAGESYPSGRQD